MIKKILGLVGIVLASAVLMVFVVGMGSVPKKEEVRLVTKEVEKEILSEITSFINKPTAEQENEKYSYNTKYPEAYISLKFTSFTNEHHLLDTGFGFLDLAAEKNEFDKLLKTYKFEQSSKSTEWFFSKRIAEVNGNYYQISGGFAKSSGAFYMTYLTFLDYKKIEITLIFPFDMYPAEFDYESNQIIFPNEAKGLVDEFDHFVKKLKY